MASFASQSPIDARYLAHAVTAGAVASRPASRRAARWSARGGRCCENVGELRFPTRIFPRVFPRDACQRALVGVFRAGEISVSADRRSRLRGPRPDRRAAVRVSALPGDHDADPGSGPADWPFATSPSPTMVAGAPSSGVGELETRPRDRGDGEHARPKLALARAVGALSRMRGGGATSAPGKVLMRLDRDAIGVLGARLRRAAWWSRRRRQDDHGGDGRRASSSRRGRARAQPAGANMAGGVATRSRGRARGEASTASWAFSRSTSCGWTRSPRSCTAPVLLANLFRDQLDRYGELETIAERWLETQRAPEQLVPNADDPLIADLGPSAPTCSIRRRGRLARAARDAPRR